MRNPAGRLPVVIGATMVARVSGGSNAGVANEPWVFVPLPASTFQSAPRQEQADSARVRALLQAARGTNALVCELAARTVDGRSGWSSDGVFTAGGAADSVAGNLMEWVHDREISAATVPLLRAAIGDSDWCVRRIAAPIRPDSAMLDRKGPQAARTLPKTPLRRNAGARINRGKLPVEAGPTYMLLDRLAGTA